MHRLRMDWLRFFLPLVLSGLVLFPVVVLAAPNQPTGPTDAAKQALERLVQAGDAYLATGQYDLAVQA
jgi:hypothetical protein